MKTNLKKVLATLGLVSIVAMNSVSLTVNAAAINGTTGSYNGTDTITVTATNDFSSDAVSTLIVKDSTGADVVGVDVADVLNETNGSFDITVGVLPAGIYSVSFSTNDQDFGATVVYVGQANEVTVNASVMPILSMALTGDAVDFGELTVDVAKAATTTTALLVNTNANNGYTIQVANAGLKSGTDEIPAAGVDENLTTGYGYGITAAVNAGATIDTVASSTATIDADFDGTDNTVVSGMGAAQNLVTATGPVSAQTTTVTYRARVSALQPTGNYTDTVTYTITGNF